MQISVSLCLCVENIMIMRFENCWMLLPNRQIGFGNLEVADGRITSITSCLSSPVSSSASPVSCLSPSLASPSHSSPSRLILPGLVNCHGHTAMTLVRGLGSGLPLQRWLFEAIFPVEAKMTPEDVRLGTLWGTLEMMSGGTVAVADMYDFPAACEEAFAALGFQANLARVGLAFSNGEPKGRLEECVAFARAAAADGIRHDLCIHSEYLTDESFCRALAAANRELKCPVHVHVSETEKEHAKCLARHGKTPIAYLAETGLLDFGGYAAHCVWCTDDDFRIMAEKNVSLIHNPSSNMKLGSGVARIPRARELGVNVALGTDGCASNDNLDMFEEMHLASLLQKGVNRDPTCLSAWDVIEMATVNGAKAIGREGLGELKVGNSADFTVVDLNRLHLTPCLDLPNLVVNSMHASDVVATVIGGRLVYADGQFSGVDLMQTKADFLAAVKRIGLCALS